MPNSFCFASAVVAVLVTAAAARADAVDRYVESHLEKQNLPGASIAVVRAGKVIKARGYGLADVELQVPASEHSVYQWGSITKTFTAVGVMLLAHDGKVRLDDSISKFYTKAPAAWSNVTVRHLLEHTSGIPGYTERPDFFQTVRKDYERDEIIGLVRDLPLKFAPGERWEYSNTGYFLLGLVIEEASAQSYADFLNTHIFGPLEMKTARVNHQFEIIPHRATGYTMQSNRLRRAEFASPTQPYAAGALVGSVLDLAKWDAAMYGDSLLPATVRETMWTPAKLQNGRTADYGLGWQLGEIRGRRWIGHGGGIPGFATFLLRMIDEKLTVIVLLNSDSNPSSLALGVADHFVPGLTFRSIEPQRDTEPELTQRLLKCLTELAERRDSEILTPEFRRNFSGSRRRHGALQKDLQQMKSFTFLLAEEPSARQRERQPGVTRLYTCKMQTGEETRYYTFALLADNHVADYSTEE